MSIVLGITTASPRGGACVLDGIRVAGRAGYEDEMRHAEQLFATIDEALAAAGIERGAADAIACDVGPGSFTGVRVGLASAKGIALALGLPLLPVLSLEAMARAARSLAGAAPVAPILDARRGEVFLAAYSAEGEAVMEPTHAPVGEALAMLDAAVPGVRLCGRMARELTRERRIEHPSCDLPDAEWIARIGAERLARGRPDLAELASIEPVYLRPPDAKRPHLERSPFA